jgi:hypothetical protein
MNLLNNIEKYKSIRSGFGVLLKEQGARGFPMFIKAEGAAW